MCSRATVVIPGKIYIQSLNKSHPVFKLKYLLTELECGQTINPLHFN